MNQILEENDFFIVVNKDPGVSIHNQSPSLVEFLTAQKKPIHFVNRIDQETSGLVLIAQKPRYHDMLCASLEDGQKIYRALLRGTWKSPEKNKIWKWSISDQAEGRKNPQGVKANQMDALTEVEMIRTNPHLTEIKAVLKTGRQHQIRKHAAIAKLPIVGDKRYNEGDYNKKIAARFKTPERMHLHAEKLVFEFEGRNYSFEKKYNLDKFFAT